MLGCPSMSNSMYHQILSEEHVAASQPLVWSENPTSKSNLFFKDVILFNEAIELGYTVKNFEIDHYICWGTPNDLKTYRYWQKFFNKVTWHPYTYNEDYLTN